MAVDFVSNFPLGLIAILGLGQMAAAAEPTGKDRIDGVGLVLLILGVGSLQLALQRMIGQTGRSPPRRWPKPQLPSSPWQVSQFAVSDRSLPS